MSKHNHELYLHCRHCLEAGEPSGNCEAKMSLEGLTITCANCGRLVAHISDIGEELRVKLRGGCVECNKSTIKVN